MVKHKLKRGLGLLDVFCIASGAMISSGLFVLPALAFAKVGPAVVFSYLLAGILVLPSVLTKAELATAMPKAGGVYFFIERSMGAPLGTIGGLASWFSLSFKSAFALMGMGIFATLINPNLTEIHIKLIAVGCCLLFMIINICGVKETGKIQVTIVLALIAILFFYITLGFREIDPQRYVPFMPGGQHALFATAGLIFVSFGGLTKICCIAEEVKNPARTIPLGMFLAYAFVMMLYGAVIFVTVGLIDSAQLSASLTPISLGASKFMGNIGSTVLAVGAFLAFISTANAGILTASRDALAMSRDCLLPRIFQRIDEKFKTPKFAIIFTSLFMIVIILFLSLENLIKTASTLMIALFLLVNLSLIVMRESRIQSYRPKFHSPLYPWIQIAGIIGYGFLIFQMGKTPLLITGAFFICGLIWYFVYAKSRVKRQAALVHVIERITAKELVNATLPDELRDIIRERDEIVEDRFDHLIKENEGLDLEGLLSKEEFFKKVSEHICAKLNIGCDELTKLFIQREEESSTIIRPGLAIPHVIIPGEHKFTILLARAKEGVQFSERSEPVHTIFILVATRDERNFHLRSLAAIAQIAQDTNFENKWLGARNKEELRDIVLLAERKRFGGFLRP